TMAGGVNVAADAGQVWPTLTLELVVARAPEVIVDAAMGSEAGARELFAGLTTVPAVQNGRVVMLADETLLRAGPRVPEAAAALQALLGNPLACPHLLGISGGAAVAGVLALVAGADAVSPVVPLAAFAGALGAIAIVALGARAGGRTTPHAVLLVGVVFNALAAATLMLVTALASYTQAQGVLF